MKLHAEIIFVSFVIVLFLTQSEQSETGEIIATAHTDQQQCPKVNAIKRTNINPTAQAGPAPVSVQKLII